ncbi:aldo/keto reductase [Pseudonocardia xinjiangensis]|uniref:Aldo/keto reductase n=1 Tax=Pseudonocardia xinjiangensis TaxID=75289 RepID=A0ABX1RM82_9PSEU|nr:aldo/keto reductase [Pseudonocardia xinjiangensis]NMH80916.1 aldo/keto reductase [Pseudonocardia xinjiangensis]
MSHVPNIRLNNGVEIPQIGYGVFQIEPDRTADAVRDALEAGYRHIDTAQGYGNEEGVGQALRDCGLSRDEVFVTTKLNNDRHGYDEAITALDESLQRLGLDHVDLFLIHWPRPKSDRFVETWKAFEKIASDGKARAIGVSNFRVPDLDRLAAETSTVPALNQIELHPWLPQDELRAYHREHGIATEAWSPLAKGGDLLSDERIVGLAEKYGKTPAQIVLAWHLQLGNIVIPKSVTPTRVRENLDVFDVELSDDDLATFAELENGTRTGPDPSNFG